nr:3-oxoacyl-[acyl-carrier-protein] synthase II, chloroplastic [Ipomoea batatas]GMD76190.1 3-oxoacyl-[acyl-carrier-protein] synthase II, chloroplastic [Ipomoea batatas]
MNPFCVPFATTNMGSAILSMDLGWMGPNYSISTACATSNFCILNAANHIIRGEVVSGFAYFLQHEMDSMHKGVCNQYQLLHLLFGFCIIKGYA